MPTDVLEKKKKKGKKMPSFSAKQNTKESFARQKAFKQLLFFS